MTRQGTASIRLQDCYTSKAPLSFSMALPVFKTTEPQFIDMGPPSAPDDAAFGDNMSSHTAQMHSSATLRFSGSPFRALMTSDIAPAVSLATGAVLFALGLLVIVISVALSDLSSVPAFGAVAVSASLGTLALYSLGTRVGTHLTCIMFIAAAAVLCYDGTVATPSDLKVQIGQAHKAAWAVVAFAVCLGTWLGSRPAEDLARRLKLLTFIVMEALIHGDSLIRYARAYDKMDMLFICLHFHAPFLTSFCAVDSAVASEPALSQKPRTSVLEGRSSGKPVRIRISKEKRGVHVRFLRRGARATRRWWHHISAKLFTRPEGVRSIQELQPLLPVSPPPSPPMRLEVLCAIQIISNMLNSGDGETAREARCLMEQSLQGQWTLRSKSEEEALRKLVAMADVECWRGFAEEINLDQADIWRAVGCVQLRKDAAVPLRDEEKLEFLQDAYENYCNGQGEFEVGPCNGRFAPASGRVIRFDTPTEALERCPNEGILDMLDVLEVEAVEENGVVFGFLPDVLTSIPSLPASATLQGSQTISESAVRA